MALAKPYPDQPKTRGLKLTSRQAQTIEKILGYATLIMVALIFMLPLYWMLSTALKNEIADLCHPARLGSQPGAVAELRPGLSRKSRSGASSSTPSSWSRSILSVELFAVTLVAYGFARIRFPGRSVLFLLMLSTLMIPYQVTLVPRFILFSKLGWVNTYLPLTVPAFTGSSFLIFLVRQYMMSIPFDLDEAAYHRRRIAFSGLLEHHSAALTSRIDAGGRVHLRRRLERLFAAA